MGRKQNQGKINAKRLDEAIAHAGLSFRKLDNDPIIKVNERTLRRARKTGNIDSKVLERLGKRLNVTPVWLSVSDELLEVLKNDNPMHYERWMNIERHPYVEDELGVDKINQRNHLRDNLALSDISYEQFLCLSEERQLEYQIEIDTLIKILNLKYFTKDEKGHPRYWTSELVKLAEEVLSGDAYDALFKLLR